MSIAINGRPGAVTRPHLTSSVAAAYAGLVTAGGVTSVLGYASDQFEVLVVGAVFAALVGGVVVLMELVARWRARRAELGFVDGEFAEVRRALTCGNAEVD